MQFTVVPPKTFVSGKSEAILQADKWNDHNFTTAFTLFIFDSDGNRTNVGWVKIGRRGMSPSKVDIPTKFESLDSTFFSLGQQVDYYQSIYALGQPTRDQILASLNDVASDLKLFASVEQEEVTTTSLLRTVSAETVRSQFNRVLKGDPPLTPYEFWYDSPRQGLSGLNFSAVPGSLPPSNTHVLIGKNGVGKTTLLHEMSRAFIGNTSKPLESGSFRFSENTKQSQRFTGMVSVAFSAFDSFKPLDEHHPDTGSGAGKAPIQYKWVGLKVGQRDENDRLVYDQNTGKPVERLRNEEELANEFANSISNIVNMHLLDGWMAAQQSLSSDLHLRALFGRLDIQHSGFRRDDVKEQFLRLSSGHRIVLLSMSSLVESVRERTLVLIDEPESHLHPPLQTAFVRAVSELLEARNGVAIIATHSPVVLQEVPRSCVWKLVRKGEVTTAERPVVETFGENVGILTREVFGLEVYKSGFHDLISKLIEDEWTFEDIQSQFGNQLGSEALLIARALDSARESGF